mgnify:CR=1 FL=1
MKSRCRLCKSSLYTNPIMELEGMPKAAQFYPEKEEFKKDLGIELNIYLNINYQLKEFHPIKLLVGLIKMNHLADMAK